MPSSREMVFHTSELLEMIILELDVSSIVLAAQAVCRRWNILIASSKAIQRAIFAEPTLDLTAERQLNPLLAKLFPPWFENSEEFHPFGTYDRKRFLTLPLARNDSFMRENASWRRMLVCQPPLTGIGLWEEVRVEGDLHKVYRQARIRTQHGLRMGELYDMTQSCLLVKSDRFRILWRLPGDLEYRTPGWAQMLNLPPEVLGDLLSFIATGDLTLRRCRTDSDSSRTRDVKFQKRFTHPDYLRARNPRRDTERPEAAEDSGVNTRRNSRSVFRCF